MLFTSEQVSCGHPDKICDQISDAIVTDCLRHDRNSRVAVECLIKDYDIVIAGEITSAHQPDFKSLVTKVLHHVGLAADRNKYTITTHITQQSADIALGVDQDGAGDQGMMYGYATDETREMLPIPYVLATEALERLRDLRSPILLPDAKCQVTYDYDKKRIDTFLISTQHREDVSLEDVRHLVERVMRDTAAARCLNLDYRALVNPTGRFVIGGSFADTGVTGRKIIADTYGGACRHGGGAFSGKDPSKVDRSAAYMARKIAKDIVRKKFAKRCEVQLAYAIGMKEPVSIAVEELITVTRDELEARLDEILEKIDEGCSPVLIVADGKLDLLLFGWEDYKRRFSQLYSPDEWQSMEDELTRHKEDEEFSGGQPDDLCDV